MTDVQESTRRPWLLALLRIPPRYSPPKTKVGVGRCAVRDHLKQRSGRIDPMNVLICAAITTAPVIGATVVLLFALLILALLVVVLW